MRKRVWSVALGLWAMGCGSSPDSGTGGAPPISQDAGLTHPVEAGVGAGGGGGSERDAATDATETNASDAGVSDGGADAGPWSATDDPDDNATDTNGDGADGIVGQDVYVTPSGLDTSPGTPTQPLRSVSAAIRLAQSRGGRVLLSAGSYTVTSLDLTGSWALYGGYDTHFASAPNRDRTVFQVDATGLLLTGADSATLAHVTVIAAPSVDPEQRSSHGIRSSIPDLRLDDVAILVGDGRPGASGLAGASGDSTGLAVAGHPGVTSTVAYRNEGAKGLLCNGLAQPATTNGANGNQPSPDGKPAGNVARGTLASPGTAGQDGSSGESGSEVPELASGLLRWGSGSDALDDATPGLGGAGGDDWDVLNPNGTLSYATCGGGGGSGACPGKPGQGAEGGGGSIGLVVLGGQVTLTRCSVQTGLGGNGGDGGLGGAAGTGGAGGVASVCAMMAPPGAGVPKAGTGGQGGNGGAGGRGGGGAGGWTMGVVTAQGAKAVVDGLTTMQLGTPGFGGESGNGRAPTGQKKTLYSFD